MRHMLRLAPLATVFVLAGCPSTQPTTDAGGSDVPTLTDASDTPPVTDAISADTGPDAAGPNDDCDPLVEGVCALPWPSNLYLAADSTRRTGYTLTFRPTSLPQNRAHLPIDPAPYRRLDGYGVGTPIMVLFPNLDASTLPDEAHIGDSLAPDAKVLLFAVQNNALVRVPYFTELDNTEQDATRKVLFVRPAVILAEATRYVVAFRDLHDRSGAVIAPSHAFAALRDRATANLPALAPRQARFSAMFDQLTAAGIDPSTLTLAWDFNTASDDALHGWLLGMRDDALATTGAAGPTLRIDTVTEFTPTADTSGRAVNQYIALELHGTVDAPNYLRPRHVGSFYGNEMNLDAQGRPARNGTRSAEFWIRIPYSAVDGTGTPHNLMQYGHGLMGRGTEVEEGYIDKLASDHQLIPFAANLTGMSTPDAGCVLGALAEASNFVCVADGLQQGLTEWVLIARAVREQLQTLPQLAARHLVVDHSQVYYSGNSQGGIFGGTYVAISPDIQRGHLGVPGNNYATLLQRSHDFTMYFQQLAHGYPNVEEQLVVLAALQLLWDQTDPVSYLRHVHNAPFPGNAPHDVLLHPARGDHQVAVVTDEIAARTPDLGIALLEHYDSVRMPYGITQAPYPHVGSGVVLFNFGNPWPTPGNHPPDDTMPDPHELPRRTDWGNAQIAHFFRTGEIIDVCGGDGCTPM